MNNPARWGLIGYGNIGREVARQIAEPGVAGRLGLEATPTLIVLSEGLFKADGKTPAGFAGLADMPELPDVFFVAIPSSDDGKAAYEYISYILSQGKLVVTAEKGALANYFEQLRAASDNFNRLGINATVGGGTRLLHVAEQYNQDLDNIAQIHLALNGTLAAIMDWVAPLQGQGMPVAEAAAQAVAQGYAEPGSSSAVEIIKAEAEGDIPKKVSIFCNAIGLMPSLVDWHKIKFTLSESEIETALNPAKPRRFLVSLYPLNKNKSSDVPEKDIIGGFKVEHEGWLIVGGFRQVDSSPLFNALVTLSGPGNGMVIGLGPDVSDGIYAITGPGAGVHPTANAMIDDFVRLKQLQRN